MTNQFTLILLVLDQSVQHRVVVIITGKGPDRDTFERRAKELKLQRIHICCLWLKFEDYPVCIGSADLGVSLHSSSSGLDLPMKVVDMLGSGVPVLALNYDCITELVEEGRTGEIFNDSQDLGKK